MADVLRSCTKTGCRWPAAASLSYRYATRQVWLLDLAPAPDPSLYDLCPHHADHLVVPKGWERVDDRTPQEVMVEPSASARAEAAARLRHPTTISSRNRELVSAGAPLRNRYAQLVEELPRLAAEAGMRRDDDSVGSTQQPANQDLPQASADVPAPAPPASTEAPGSAQAPPTLPEAENHVPASSGVAPPAPGGVRMPAMPSRDLAPMPTAEQVWPPSHPPEPDEPPQPPPAPLPGQLVIPVDDLLDDGVVVSFDFAGGRRRTPRG